MLKYAAIILILCSLSLLPINLGTSPFWIDESIMVMPAAKILETGVPSVAFDSNFMPWQIKNNIWDPATPLYRYALSLFIWLFGLSEFSARFFSVLCGILCIGIWYIFFRDIYGKKIALITIMLTAASPVFIKYAREARYFTLLMLLIAFTLYFLHKAVNSRVHSGRFLWPSFMLMTVLTHPMGFLVIPIIAGYLLLNKTRIYFQKCDYLTFLILLVIYLPTFMMFWDTLPFFHRVDSSNHISGYQPSLFYYFEIIYSIVAHVIPKGMLRSFRNEFAFVLSLNPLLFLLGLVIVISSLIVTRKQNSKDNSKLILLWFFIPLSLLSMQEVKFPRYIIIYALPLCFLVIAHAIYCISTLPLVKKYQDFLISFLVCTVIILPQIRVATSDGLISSEGRLKVENRQFGYLKYIIKPSADNFEGITFQYKFLKDKLKKDDIIITTLDDASLSFYLNRTVYGFLNNKHSDEFFLNFLKRGQRIWFIDSLEWGNFCLTDDKEPVWIDCRKKYEKFYNIISTSSNIAASFENVKIYLYNKNADSEIYAGKK